MEYRNELGKLVDAHTIQCTNRKRQVTTITADKIVIATGGRPTLPADVPGAAEFALTSDDLFAHDAPPGKTLVVGASYVALECAGFLTALGFPTSVMARSILLRGFDQQIAEQIGAYMAHEGTRFIRPAVPTKIEKNEAGKLVVSYTHGEAGAAVSASEEFDTVFFATGRTADTANLGLAEVGVTVNPRNSKIITTNEQTSVANIYAIGDVLDGKLELTPTAIMAGRLLARRLFNNSTVQMDYRNVPTTVFTPIEYGCVGYSEEDATAEFGADAIDVYHAYASALEWKVAHRPDNVVYCKLVVRKADDRVLGLHYLGPNAGEVTQGYAVAIKMGATKAQFDSTVGIHPTISEEFVDMHITKASGKDPKRTGC